MKKPTRNRRLVIMAVTGALLAVALIVTGITNGKERQASGCVWHTTYTISYKADRDFSDSIVTVLGKLDRSVNAFNDSSVTGKINSNTDLRTDPHFEYVYNESLRIHKLTGGAFDPTLGPAIRAWGFGKGHRATCDTLDTDSLLLIIGIEKSRLNAGRIDKPDPRMEFNFSAIAKGYACDVVAEKLRQSGAREIVVEIGGEVRNLKEDCIVSVDYPTASSDDMSRSSAGLVSLPMGYGMATSGNYRNYHTQGNRRYGHTINPATARPAETDLLSVTVIAPTCMEADALATAMMAMGRMRSLKLADSLGVAVMVIDTNGKCHTSKKWKWERH